MNTIRTYSDQFKGFILNVLSSRENRNLFSNYVRILKDPGSRQLLMNKIANLDPARRAEATRRVSFIAMCALFLNNQRHLIPEPVVWRGSGCHALTLLAQHFHLTSDTKGSREADFPAEVAKANQLISKLAEIPNSLLPAEIARMISAEVLAKVCASRDLHVGQGLNWIESDSTRGGAKKVVSYFVVEVVTIGEGFPIYILASNEPKEKRKCLVLVPGITTDVRQKRFKEGVLSSLDPQGIGASLFLANKEKILGRLKLYQAATRKPLDAIGYSFGGALIQRSSAHFPALFSNLFAFNSPGVDEETAARWESLTHATRPKLLTFHTEGDFLKCNPRQIGDLLICSPHVDNSGAGPLIRALAVPLGEAQENNPHKTLALLNGYNVRRAALEAENVGAGRMIVSQVQKKVGAALHGPLRILCGPRNELITKLLDHLTSQLLPPVERARTGKRRIVILTSTSGGGHLAAANSVENALKALPNGYEISTFAPFEEMALGSYFNYFQQKGYYKLLRLLINLEPLADWTACPFQVRPKIIQALKDLKPDLLISVFPVANAMTLKLTQQLAIPMLVLATDLEARHFLRGIDHPDPRYFQFGVAFDDPFVKAPFLPQLAANQLQAVGYPIRKEFSRPDPAKMDEWRGRLNIGENDKVIMIMIGAQGCGNLTAHYARIIANSSKQYGQKVHVLACCGNNPALFAETSEVQRSVRNQQVTVHAFQKLPGVDVAAMMALSNLFVTKPGGSSVNEALAMNLRMLFVTVGLEALPWELGNFDFSVKKGYGSAIVDDAHFLGQLDAEMAKPPIAVPHCPGRNFEHNIQQLVHKMLTDGEALVPQTPQLKSAAKTQQLIVRGKEILNRERTFYDKVMILLTAWGVKEGLKNLEPKIELLRNYLASKRLSPHEISLLSQLLKRMMTLAHLEALLFPVNARPFHKKVQNFIIQFALKVGREQIHERVIPYLPSVVSAHRPALQGGISGFFKKMLEKQGVFEVAGFLQQFAAGMILRTPEENRRSLEAIRPQINLVMNLCALRRELAV